MIRIEKSSLNYSAFQVEHCEMSILNDHTKFKVTLRCKLETMKQAIISIVDEQNITSAVPTDQSPNR